jgi:UDP-3-O-acyl-N-acetylglucosamine deacetylase
MEKRIVSDVVKAFKCTPGSRCIEKSLIDAEKTADRLVQRSSASSTAHRKAIGTVDAKQASPSNLRSKAVTGNPLNVLGPELPIADASSERFWQEAAHVAAAGSDKPQRKVPKNSAKAFVHDMISAAHRAANADPKDGTHAIATVAAGPMSETKVKTF